jgi:chlorobactene glucosyltransferase
MRVLSLIVLAVWLLTVARTILNLILVPRLRPRMPRRTPLVSVIIPARDEERSIERTVRAMLAQTYPALELIVVNDRSTDRTSDILGSIDDPRLIVIEGQEPPPGWLGKPHALHLGAQRARGELLLFVDADLVYAPDAVAAAVAQLEESGASMLSLLPHFELHGFWEHVAIVNLAVFAYTMLPLWATNRTRIPLLGIGGGTGNLVRRDDYDALGGHEALRDAVVDDVGLARLMRRGGRRTAVALANDLVSLRMYHGLREIVDGFTKNTFAVVNRSYLAALFFLIAGVIVHLLPYGLAVAGDVIAIVTIGLIVLSRVILFAALRYRLDNAVFGHIPMLLIWFWILLRSVWLTGVRRRLLWRGRTYDADKTRFGGRHGRLR